PARARRPGGVLAGTGRHARTARRGAARPRLRPAARRPVSGLARPLPARRLGPEPRHRAAGRRRAVGRGPGHGDARGTVARRKLRAGRGGGGRAGGGRSPARHVLVGGDGHAVGAPRLLARAHARRRLRLRGPLAARLRHRRTRRRHALRVGPPGRSPAAPRPPPRYPHPHRRRRRGAVRPRGHAGRAAPAVRPDGARQRAAAAGRRATSRRPQRAGPGRDAARAVAAGAVFGRRVRRGGVRVAGRGRAARGRGQPARRVRARGARPAAARPAGAVSGIRRDPRARFGLAVLAAAAVVAAAAPAVSSGRPAAQRDVAATRFLPPLATDVYGAFHPLGTDRFGRDVWTRLVYGARVSLAVGTLAVLLGSAVGVAVGAAAGYGPGAVRLLLLALTDFALAVPRVVLVLVLAALWRPGTALVVLVLGLTGWMSVARLVHAE